LRSGPKRAYARYQAVRLREAERALVARAVLTLAIQEGEAETLRALAPGTRVATLPIGVDLARFREPSPARGPVVLLPGSFLWPPNVAGAERFLDDGWPRVRARHPGARLRVAGKGPPPALHAAVARAGGAGAGVELRADVPSMEAELAEATVVVVPLWVGAGARVKIVEAMAARAPVVATHLAAEGLDLEPELHYVAAETPEELGDGVARLLDEPAERDRLAAVGHSLAETRWSIEAVSRRQAALIAEALGIG
ncbi:MAG: glycosyltransferase family 4 protein, partial [Hyphomicrobiales bacterium]